VREFRKKRGVDIETDFNGVSMEKDPNGKRVYIYSEECGDPYLAAQIARFFFMTYRAKSKAFVAFEWSESCDRSIEGEFGGGAILVSAAHIECKSTGSIRNDMVNAFIADNKKSKKKK
jgi:hypothetical protein